MRTLLSLSVLSLLIGAPAFADANEMPPFELEEMTPMELLDEKSRFPEDLASEIDVLVIENMEFLVGPPMGCPPESRWDQEPEACAEGEGAAE